MTDILDAVATFFGGIVEILTTFLVPASGTLSPVQTVMWAGLVLSFILFVVTLIRRFASTG